MLIKESLNSFSDVPLAVWLLSTPKTNDMWYEKLVTSSEHNDILRDLIIATTSVDDGSCLALSKDENSPQTYSLSSINCNERRPTICRLNPSISNPVPKKPYKFPCVEKSNIGRRKKRSIDAGSEVEKGINIFWAFLAFEWMLEERRSSAFKILYFEFFI